MKNKYFKSYSKFLFFVCLLLVCCYISYGQKDTTENNICKERGHIISDIIASTLMYCPSYIIDTDSTTIEVFPACNWITYICKRCGQEISERNKERRVVLWKKE